MRIKKNGKVVNLTESDLKRIVKRTLNEQGIGDGVEMPDEESGSGKGYKDVVGAIRHFHPELRSMKPSVGQAIEHIFEKDGKFSMKNMRDVCKANPEFCKVAFTTPEVMGELFKVV